MISPNWQKQNQETDDNDYYDRIMNFFIKKALVGFWKLRGSLGFGPWAVRLLDTKKKKRLPGQQAEYGSG